jgi:hypothetical protein
MAVEQQPSRNTALRDRRIVTDYVDERKKKIVDVVSM